MPPLKVFVVTDPGGSWFEPYGRKLVSALASVADVQLVNSHDEITSCDIAFYLSYRTIVPEANLARSRNNIVVHASDLPHGRGWSPLTWQVLDGVNQITLSLFEAATAVDSGSVYFKDTVQLEGSELIEEIHTLIGNKTVSMCCQFIERFPEVAETGVPQSGKPSYYPRRTPEDSRLDPSRTIAEQFNLLRVVDNDRYPAFFDWNHRRYILRIEVDDGFRS